MNKRKSKKSFNSRLSKLERLFQSIPASLVVVFFSIPLYIVGTLAVGLSPARNEPICVSGNIFHYRCWVPQLIESAFNSIETIAILSAIILYWKEAPNRKDQRHYEAWQVVEQAEGKETSYSRYKALQDLNNDDVSLERLDASGADLSRIILPGAKLQGANLQRSDLSMAILGEANLIGANLIGANLKAANLQNARLDVAHLTGANLSYANLIHSDLKKADLTNADLTSANLANTNLEDAYLNSTDLSGAALNSAYLNGADFIRANLINANLSNANLSNANLEGANMTSANFASVLWNENTIWTDAQGFKTAKNIPSDLRQHLCNLGLLK